MTILISSHSKANDIWKITDYFLNKNFKCDLKIYLGANGEKVKNYPKNWRYIYKGEDKSFSKSLISYLEEIEDEYIILMLDDFVILEEVDCELLNKGFEFLKENDGVYLRLKPNPRGDKKINKYFSKIIVPDSMYITSLQMVIWKREFLIKLLEYDFNPWEFEIKAGKTKEAIENKNGFFVTNFDFIKYTHFVEKGKFYPFIRELLQKENINYEFKREFMDIDTLQKTKENKFIKNFSPVFVNKVRKLLGKREL